MESMLCAILRFSYCVNGEELKCAVVYCNVISNVVRCTDVLVNVRLLYHITSIFMLIVFV